MNFVAKFPNEVLTKQFLMEWEDEEISKKIALEMRQIRGKITRVVPLPTATLEAFLKRPKDFDAGVFMLILKASTAKDFQELKNELENGRLAFNSWGVYFTKAYKVPELVPA